MIARWVAILGWFMVLMIALQVRRRLRNTTLTTACVWAISAACTGIVASIATVSVGPDRVGWSDLAWYATAVTSLCPGIAVLGARRPGAGTWGFFVLLPLLFVLAWPALAATRVLSSGVPLELETPAVVGFGVVLVMAVGNWIGTRFTLPSCIYAIGVLLLLIPSTPFELGFFFSRPQAGLFAAVAFVWASGIAISRAEAGNPSDDVFNLLWLDFVDTFGMVWAKRVMDRVNQSAAHEKWSATLDWHGFEWQAECSEEDIRRTRERIEHTLRWLLKRFVDPEWIDRRLEHSDASDDA